jgi:hypothetical protein
MDLVRLYGLFSAKDLQKNFTIRNSQVSTLAFHIPDIRIRPRLLQRKSTVCTLAKQQAKEPVNPIDSMILRKVLKIIFGLLLLFALAIGFTSIQHPIILKWVTGAAKHHGQSMPARVYTNGQINDRIKVFYSDNPNNYLLSLAAYDSLGKLAFLNINLNEKWIGTLNRTSKNDYDFIAGHLFQSETGAHFAPLQDGMKGFNFDTHLTFNDRQIQFNLPPNYLNFDSVKIVLP